MARPNYGKAYKELCQAVGVNDYESLIDGSTPSVAIRKRDQFHRKENRYVLVYIIYFITYD